MTGKKTIKCQVLDYLAVKEDCGKRERIYFSGNIGVRLGFSTKKLRSGLEI
jgi:hypothetical protein